MTAAARGAGGGEEGVAQGAVAARRGEKGREPAELVDGIEPGVAQGATAA